ncbi:U3 small nucleolar RNA-associated protein 18 homolog [Trematomus bernacchii]|uniref:U3 small nucleolar RNA-associated protein 18 homolog n=1 Tax=Trematomus bernacchii TaxID=40690 RepID=UPI00146DC163|nr:U3 small nucleolar RNA-associated protein 18 homolog [Trematomus bernacchii]
MPEPLPLMSEPLPLMPDPLPLTQKPGGQRRVRNQNLVAVLGEEDESVRLLEDLLFGGEEQLLDHLLQVDKQQTSVSLDDGDDESADSEEEGRANKREAVWIDEDDELFFRVDMKHRFRRDLIRGEAEETLSSSKLQLRMREQFQKSMGGAPSWAENSVKKKKKKKNADDDDDDDEEDDDEDDELMRRTGDFLGSSERLPGSILRMKKCLHANAARPSPDALTSVQFHPNAQVVMTAGLDQSLSLFQVDGKSNPQIQSIRLEKFPVHRAAFSRDGEMVIATSLRNKMFYLYDMMEGKVTPVTSVRGLNEARVKEFSVCPEGGALLLSGTRGYLHLLTLKTREVVSSMKINGEVVGVAFSPDGSKVFANSEEGEVYVWDLRSSRCVSRFSDEGCVTGTSIAASRDGRYLACGSQSGVVNVYSQEACLRSDKPRPLKAVMNLLTPVTALTFNPSSEILAMASRSEDEAVRMLHLPSLSVFSNFPVSKRKIVYRASSLDFSPHSGFFSLANNKGHAPLFRLLHYKDF